MHGTDMAFEEKFCRHITIVHIPALSEDRSAMATSPRNGGARFARRAATWLSRVCLKVDLYAERHRSGGSTQVQPTFFSKKILVVSANFALVNMAAAAAASDACLSIPVRFDLRHAHIILTHFHVHVAEFGMLAPDRSACISRSQNSNTDPFSHTARTICPPPIPRAVRRAE